MRYYSISRKILGLLLIIAAFCWLGIPVKKRLWKIAASDNGKEIQRLVGFDDSLQAVITCHSSSTPELRRLAYETGHLQRKIILPATKIERSMVNIALSNDQKYFLSWNNTHALASVHEGISGSVLCDLRPGNPENEKSPPRAVAFSPDTSLVAVQFRSEIVINSLITGTEYCRFMMHHGSYGMYFNEPGTPLENMSISPDNHYLAVGGGKQGVLLYNLSKKFYIDLIAEQGVPLFLAGDRLAVIPRRGEKVQPTIYQVLPETMAVEKKGAALPDEQVLVSHNKHHYFCMPSKVDSPKPKTRTYPTWIPHWLRNKFIEWFDGSEIWLNVTAYDIATGEKLNQYPIFMQGHLHQSLLRPDTPNQLMVNHDGRYLAILNGNTISLWDPHREISLPGWLLFGVLLMGGCLTLLIPPKILWNSMTSIQF